MKIKKISLFIVIILFSIFFNINECKAAEKSKCNLDDKGGSCTFYKSDWTFSEIEKYKDLCMTTINSYTGSGKCVFYYTETVFDTCTVYDAKTKKIKAKENCEPVQKSNKTAIYDPSNNKKIEDGYVTKESDIFSNNKAKEKSWSKMVITFSDKGQVGLAYDILNTYKLCNKKAPINKLCEFGQTVTADEKNAHTNEAITNKTDDTSSTDSAGESTVIVGGKWSIDSCEELLGDDLIDVIQTIVNIARVMVPILLIVFGILDFGKAIFLFDEGEMKKSQSKFIKRLIVAVAFFLIPVIIKLLLNIANGIWGNIDPDICGIKF